VVLERQIVANLGPLAAKAGGSAGIIGATVKLPPKVADPVAAAFSHTFWWSVGAIMIAFIPTLFLPNRAPQAAASPEDTEPKDPIAEGESAPSSEGRGEADRVAGVRLD